MADVVGKWFNSNWQLLVIIALAVSLYWKVDALGTQVDEMSQRLTEVCVATSAGCR